MIYRNKRDQEAWLREKTLSSLKENVYLQEHDIVQVAENKHFYEVVTEVTEIPLQNHLYAKSISSDTASSASTADKLKTPRNIAITGAVTGNADFDGTKNISIQTTLNNIDANKITSGTISVDRLPKSAFDEFLAVENKTARLALTKDRVQNGDTVKETDTGRMYLVINDTKLNIEEGYQEYTTIVDWASITGKPSDFHPETHTHTKEQITNFPQSLKNPYALYISVNGTRKGSYDGSSVTNINVAAADLNVYNKGEIDAKLSEKAPSQHQHPTWYYTKNEIDTKLSSKANTSHAHNTLKIINGSKSITYDGTSAKEITIEAGGGVPVTHTHSSENIVNLNGYIKHNYGGSLNTTDTLNLALGKLEKNIELKASINHSHDGVYVSEEALAEYVPKFGNTTISGNITVTGELYSNNNVVAYSDRKLKENLVKLDNSIIDKLKQINFYNFNMISDKSKRKRVGVIAQELEELFPELVFKNEDGIKSVDYIGLNTYFSFAIQQKLFGL